MATTNIPIDLSKDLSRRAYNATRHLANAMAELNAVLDKSGTMVDGSDYSLLDTNLGVAAGKGEAFYAELNSLMGKLNSDASVSSVNAAINQFIARVGVS